jgi:hypothetical protein
VASEKQATWRRVQVPPSLVGKSRTKILEWARSKLDGQDADLKRADTDEITAGTIKEVLLKPKKAGFFLPTGEFIESLGPIKLKDDIETADRQMETLERDNAWADEECRRFKKPDGDKNVRAIWEHGQRIAAYVKANERRPFTVHKLLEKRGGKDGYSLHAHQTASKLFEWRPNANADDPIFKWTWELADAVLKFSKKNAIRDSVADLVERELSPRRAPLGAFVVFLRGPKGKRGDLWQRSDVTRLGELRDKLKATGVLESQEVQALVRLVSSGTG